jgi:hypothetical protein
MPSKPSKPSRDDPAQSERFIEAAKEAGPDETGEAFERAFKKVARPKRDQETQKGQSPKT